MAILHFFGFMFQLLIYSYGAQGVDRYIRDVMYPRNHPKKVDVGLRAAAPLIRQKNFKFNAPIEQAYLIME